MSNTQRNRVETFWQSFLVMLEERGDAIPEAYEAWSFGDSPEMADVLGSLVLEGTKTATASLVWVYEMEGEPLPQVGDYSIILDGQGKPLCIIRTTNVSIRPFDEVNEEQAYLEGEGDRSLAFWRKVHWRFFSRECKTLNCEPSQKMPILCEHFQRVFP